jgi:lysophospholipase L1-like esterase
MNSDAMRIATLVMAGTLLMLAPAAVCLADSVDRAAGLNRTRAALSPRGSAKIVCFGDSITGIYYHTGGRRAWPEMLEIALRKACPKADVTVINAGISGHTTVNTLARIEKDVLRHKPNLVAVMFGMNDVVRVPLDTFAANLTEIIRQCRQIRAEVLL